MNSNMNRFEYSPSSVKITRSRFKMNFSHKTTFNAGDLIPLKHLDLLPGDTFSVDLASVVRMSTPIFPVMDNAYLDVYAFAIPYRLLWDHTKEFFGENTDGPWAQDIEYVIPQCQLNYNSKGSIADQLGLPLGDFSASGGLLVSDLPFRAYALCWNEWFRDQNVSTPLFIKKDDSQTSMYAIDGNNHTWFYDYGGTEGVRDMVTKWHLDGRPLPVAKFHDLFTSALPEPQKGPAVTLPLSEDFLPLNASDTNLYELGGTMRLAPSEGEFNETLGLFVSDTGSQVTAKGDTVDGAASFPITRTNLYADVSEFGAISINTLRQMFAMQRLFELDARGGTRYREVIKSHFHVTSADARMQVPEFLAGKRIPINMTSVAQTSSTNDTSPQGNLAAFSHTRDKESLFTYSATEHCMIMFFACVRTDQSYSQGIAKPWLMKRRYDLYWPVFANLGEQPIYRKELFVYGGEARDEETMAEEDEPFGFQEAWYQYRHIPNSIAGALRPDYAQSLSAWTYANNFMMSPTLSPEFIYETRENVDRTLAVKSQVEDQFIADFYFDITAVRPMPLYSVPGLGSHY